jgi:hypothetical protein
MELKGIQTNKAQKERRFFDSPVAARFVRQNDAPQPVTVRLCVIVQLTGKVVLRSMPNGQDAARRGMLRTD